MFGFFGKRKFHQQVIDMIEDMTKTLIVKPNNSERFKAIEKELEEAGKAEEAKNLWPMMVAHAFCTPLDYKEHIDYAYKNFNVRQAAFYSISTYITQISSNGVLADYKKTEPELYDACKHFWGVCGDAYLTNPEEFGCCIMSVEGGGNPFD